jgi:hypothetical protein
VIDLWVSELSSSGDLGHLQTPHLRQDFRLAAFRELVNFPFPSSEIACQIKNLFGINDGHDLDISEWVLSYKFYNRKINANQRG